MLGIGTFSRASLLSVKALRAYHESGLLVPARVDDRTGYRWYEPSQLTDARVIRRLRDLDLPLADIATVLTGRDPDVTAKVLADHEAVMRERLADASRIVAELQSGMELPAMHTPVHVGRIEAQTTLEVRGTVTEREYAGFLGVAYDAIGRVLTGTAGLVPAGPFGALYPPTAHDEPHEVVAYAPLVAAAPLPDDRGAAGIGHLPAVDVAVLVHEGPYDTVSGTYALLGTWVAANATPAELPVREIYLTSYSETDDPSAFRTEICWPIDVADQP